MHWQTILIACVACWAGSSHSLVYHLKLGKGAKGCVSPQGAQLAVGEEEIDTKTCGAINCQDTEGGALVYYCQIPVTFAKCKESGVMTGTTYPNCCYKCTRYVDCSRFQRTRPKPTNTTEPKTATEGTTEPKTATEGILHDAIVEQYGDLVQGEEKEGSQIDGFDLVTNEKLLDSGTKPAKYEKANTTKSKTFNSSMEIEDYANVKFGGGTPIKKFGETTNKAPSKGFEFV